MSYRLPRDIIPIHYHIIINPSDNTFKGHCSITFQKNNPTNTIILNASELNIKVASINNQKATIKNDEDYEQVTLTFDSIPSTGKLDIIYTGIITDSMVGFYQSKRDNEIILSTQFESVYARKCFPCFDEPNFKAVFKLELIIPFNKCIRANVKGQ